MKSLSGLRADNYRPDHPVEAYEAGLGHVGNVPFLIQCVLPSDVEVSMPAYTTGLLFA
jgi:hypothetical protein